MAKQHINFNARTIAERIPPGNKASVTLENNVGICYCWTTKDGLTATAITDSEYPERAAFILLNNIKKNMISINSMIKHWKASH